MRMYKEFRIKTIDELKFRSEVDAILSEIVSSENWPRVVSHILTEILSNPDWLVNESVFPKFQVKMNKALFEQLAKKSPKKLNAIIFDDKNAVHAIVIRFMEVFSNTYEYPYLYRGGSLDDLESGVRGTFTFFFDEAMNFVERSYAGKRTNPCLIALPVAALVNFYKISLGQRISLIAEHGYDGIFNASFDVFLENYLPEDLAVYILTQNNS